MMSSDDLFSSDKFFVEFPLWMIADEAGKNLLTTSSPQLHGEACLLIFTDEHLAESFIESRFAEFTQCPVRIATAMDLRSAMLNFQEQGGKHVVLDLSVKPRPHGKLYAAEHFLPPDPAESG
jgi:hypothetical protein